MCKNYSAVRHNHECEKATNSPEIPIAKSCERNHYVRQVYPSARNHNAQDKTIERFNFINKDTHGSLSTLRSEEQFIHHVAQMIRIRRRIGNEKCKVALELLHRFKNIGREI